MFWNSLSYIQVACCHFVVIIIPTRHSGKRASGFTTQTNKSIGLRKKREWQKILGFFLNVHTSVFKTICFETKTSPKFLPFRSEHANDV